MDFKQKYFKYKYKYLELKKQKGGILNKGTFRISQNKLFMIDTSGLIFEGLVYDEETGIQEYKRETDDYASLNFYIIKDSIDLINKYLKSKPVPLLKVIRERNFGIYGDYYEITSNFVLPKPDCLKLAEGMSLADPLYSKTRCQLRVRDLPKQLMFGARDDSNISYSQDVRKYSAEFNERANPSSGDAYAIVKPLLEDETIEEGTPYHVAYVFLEDGDDRLTIETDASKSYIKNPVFDMYSIKVPENTFHARYKYTYTTEQGGEPTTIVLTKRS
jgi:hypothetical protein